MNAYSPSRAIALLCFVLPAALPAQNLANREMRDTTLDNFRRAIDKYVASERDVVRQDDLAEKYLSTRAFDKLFAKYFSLVTYNKESIAQGNSGTFNTSSDQTYFNFSLARYRNLSFTSIGSKINLVDPSGSFFSKQHLTHGNQYTVNHSLVLRKSREVRFGGEEPLRRNIGRRTALLDSLELVEETFASNFKSFRHRQQKAKHLVERLMLMLPTSTPRDSIRVKLLRAKQELQKINADSLKYYIYGGVTAGSYIDDFKSKAVDREISGDGLLGVKLKWISFGASFERDNYSTYDSLMPVGSRFGSVNFNQWSGNISFNFLRQKIPYTNTGVLPLKKRSSYFGITYSLTRSTNYALISDTEVQQVGQKLDSTHFEGSSQKVKNISSTPFKEFVAHKIAAQYSHMFAGSIPIGVDLVGSLEIKKGYDPTGDLKAGLLFKFIQTDDPKSIVNLELFVAFSDLGDNKKTGVTAWERKSFGLTASVPFSKIFF